MKVYALPVQARGAQRQVFVAGVEMKTRAGSGGNAFGASIECQANRRLYRRKNLSGETMNSFVIADPKKCIGCHTCEVACVLAHFNGKGLRLLSAAHFIPRLKMVKTAQLCAPVQCHHCDDAPCAKVCLTGAIIFRNNSVQVDQARCIGCKNCMITCPVGALEIVTVERVERNDGSIGDLNAGTHKVEAQKCDLCIDQPEGPACVRVCPTKGLRLVDDLAVATATRARRENAAIQSTMTSI
jgi:electron transport protein HydN